MAGIDWAAWIQSGGIIASLSLTAFTIHRDTKARRATDLLTFEQGFREIWAEQRRRPELRRVTEMEVNQLEQPITTEETEFLNVVFVRYYTTFLLWRNHSLPLLPLTGITADIRNFLRLPIPKEVWARTRESRDPQFIAFIEKKAYVDR